MGLMILATGLYINACAKGEHMIPQTVRLETLRHSEWSPDVIMSGFIRPAFSGTCSTKSLDSC